MKKRKDKVGGMALFNGLMLKSKKREVVGRLKEDGYINFQIFENNKQKKDEEKFTIYDIPIIRGMLSMKNMIASSVPYVLSSAQNTLNVKSSKSEKIDVDKFEIAIAYIISIGLILTLLAAIPNFISSFLTHNVRNISQAIIQTTVFIIYLLLLSKIDSLKAIFEYHGAEHKVANAYENLSKEDINVENVRKQSRFHIRCGGNFVVYLFLLIIFITLLIPSNNLIFKTILQVLIMPFLAGFSYELVMYTQYLPNFLKFLAYPAMSIQFITTKEPSDDKIQLAIYTLFGCINGNKEVSVKTFFNTYLKKNKKISFNMKDALIIISHLKNISTDELFIKIDEVTLDYNEQVKSNMMLDKLFLKNYPIEYITNKVNFYNETYKVNEKVLIPRIDSELIVKEAIEYIDKEKLETLMDMCTGSGCLGISISRNSTIKKSVLIDISQDALDIANYNIQSNKINDKCMTINSDLFSNLNSINKKFDILVSNPPYIKKSDLKLLDDSVKKEPLIALDGGEDGLVFYTKILNNAPKYLNDNAILIFEIGFDELKPIKELINNNTNYKFIKSLKDYGGNDRSVICRFQKK